MDKTVESQFFKMSKDGVINVSFLLIPEFSMVALLSAIEPMRVANRMAGKDLFRWQLLSHDEEQIFASNGLTLSPCTPVKNITKPDNLFVCASFNPEKYLYPDTIAWLKRIANDTLLGAVDTGCYLLQAADIIKNHRITMHWEAIPAFREQFQNILVTNELFEIDRNLITCSGGTAMLDLMLFIIHSNFGKDLALDVCEQFIKGGIRQKSDAQRIDLAARLGVYHPRLLQVIERMEDNIELPLTQEELALSAKISVRQLERLFKQYLNLSPSAYYLSLRLTRARSLLRETSLSVTDVAVACGFVAVAHFSRAYSKYYGKSPSAERPKF